MFITAARLPFVLQVQSIIQLSNFIVHYVQTVNLADLYEEEIKTHTK